MYAKLQRPVIFSSIWAVLSKNWWNIKNHKRSTNHYQKTSNIETFSKLSYILPVLENETVANSSPMSSNVRLNEGLSATELSTEPREI